MHGIPAQKALIFDKGDILVCKYPPRGTEGFILGYLEGTRHMGFAGEGLFHPDQVVMVEDSGSSSAGAGAGAGAAGNRGSSHTASAGSFASDARRRANGDSAAPSPSRGGGGGGRQKLYVAKTSSVVSERVSRTTGEHFGYVVDTKHPAKEKRPCPDKSKGYFHPEQVQIVDDSSAPSIHDSAVRPNPDDKNKSTGRESSSARACTSQNISASKRPSDPGTSSWPLYEEDTEIKLSRGLSAKRIKRSDSAKLSTGESNNSGLHAKMLGGRFQPPQREQPPSNAAKRKVETIKPDQTRAMVARKDSTRSDASFGSTNAKASAKSDMDEAKEKRAASAAKGDESQGRSRIDTSANSSAAAALSSSEYVQVPTAMAMKSRFPPGCVVVHTSDDESTNAYTICSVYLRLSSDELVSGRSNFDVLFKVGTGTNAKILSEESLVYARDCPIFIKSNAVPHVKSQSGWVPATVKSSITLPDALEEDYVVTIANGGTAHVPRDAIRYRNPTLPENTGLSTSIEHAKPASVANSVPDPSPPVAVVVAPAPTSTAETVSTESVTEDASNGSSSLQRNQKKVANASDHSATIVCRIDVPDRLTFGTVQKLLSPKIEPMKKRLKVEMFVVGSDNPPPRDADIVRSFGDIFPRPLPSGDYPSSILISGQAKNTEKARKATIFFLKEGVNDGESLAKDLEAGCSKARAITNSAKDADSAATSANASSVPKSREAASEKSKLIGKPASKPEKLSRNNAITEASSQSHTAEYRLPFWVSHADVRGFFEGSQVKKFERQSGVSVEISDRRCPMNVALSSSISKDLWNVWESFTGAISWTIDEDMRPRFLYDMVMYNYGGKMERKTSPVLKCQSPFDSEERLLMAVLPIPTRPQGSYAGYIIGNRGRQRSRIEEIDCTFDVYEFPSRQDLSYVLVTGAIRDDVKTARDIVQERIDECHDLREIEMDDGDDEDEDEDEDEEEEEPQVIYLPPSNDLEDEEEDDEPEVVFRPQRPQEGKRTIQILNLGVFIGNEWAQVKRWQSKFGRRGVKISVRVRQSEADVSGPEHELDSVVREINSWQQRSQRPSTPPRRQPRRTSDVVFGGVVM